MVVQLFLELTEEQFMEIASIPHDELRHTRAAQEWLAEGRQLARRCGPLSEATTARIQALPLEQLESLAEELLDFHGAENLAAWLSSQKLNHFQLVPQGLGQCPGGGP